MFNTNALKEALAKWNLPLDQIKSWSQEETEEIYTAAYGLYSSDQYGEAGNLFTQLIFRDPSQERYWRGLAASRQMEAKYEEALHAWSLATLLQEESSSHFHAAECLFSLGQREEGLKALKNAEEAVGLDPELQQKIDLLRETYG